MEDGQVGFSESSDGFHCEWGCFPSGAVDWVNRFKKNHDTHELASSRRQRSEVRCDFKLVVVIVWGKANLVIVSLV